MDKLTSWIVVSAMAAPLLFGCETSNRNYSSGRVVDASSHQGVISGSNDGSLVGQSMVSNSANTAAPAPVVQDVTLQEAQPEVSAGQSSVAQNSQGSSVVEEVVVDEELAPTMPSGITSQFEDATASTNGYYQNQQISQPVSRPTYNPNANQAINQSINQNVTIPGSVAVPQQNPYAQQTVSRPQQQVQPQPQPQAQAPAPAPQSADQSQQSTSSGNWLLVDSTAAQQDANNTASTQKALQNSTAVTYQASQTPTAGPDQYRVVKGDTLYSIAFRYGLDYHTLAEINKIAPPYSLAVGQVLTLKLKASAPKAYEVQKGDTLYSIARKNNQSVSVLASVNNLEPPYSLTVGQKIYLSRDEAASAASSAGTDKGNMVVPVAGQQVAANTTTKPSTTTTTTADKATTTKPTQQQTASATKPAQSTTATTPIINSKTRKVSGVTWSWPTSGRVVEQFSTAEQGNKGLDIEGKRGQAIFSAADGQVVYSGNALRGFGNLIIINHSNEFLSAYAHNDALLVKEGQKVKRGQQIARMGNTDASSVRLHFEVRYRGQSVNPLNYLPK